MLKDVFEYLGQDFDLDAIEKVDSTINEINNILLKSDKMTKKSFEYQSEFDLCET